MGLDWNERGYSKGRETRRMIVAKAAKLFAKHGYDATTIDQIAKACKTTKGAIYAHFKKKRDVYMACLGYCFETLSQGCDVDVSEDPPKVLRRHISWLANHLKESPPTRALLLELMHGGDSSLSQDVIEQHLRKPYEQIRNSITRVNNRLDASAFTFMIFSVLLIAPELPIAYRVLENDSFEYTTDPTIDRLVNIIQSTKE